MIHPDLSIVMHVYNSQELIDRHVKNWEKIPVEYRGMVEFIIIDDCSDLPLKVDKSNINIRLFRVIDDIDWNMPGCKNLGAIHCKSDWLLFHDADNFANPEDIVKLLDNISNFNKSALYRFGLTIDGVVLDSHINTLLMYKDNFFKVGMIDEDFSGNYGYEDVHFNMLWAKKIGPIIIINDIVFKLIDHKTAGLNRDTGVNQILGTEKIYLRNYENSTGKIRFKWLEVE